MIVESILRIAVLIVRGGGSLVIPILIALERLGSKTISSLVLTFSCCFYATGNRNSNITNGPKDET